MDKRIGMIFLLALTLFSFGTRASTIPGLSTPMPFMAVTVKRQWAMAVTSAKKEACSETAGHHIG